MTYKCSDGYSSSIWGPHAWVFLDTIALNYPYLPTDDDKNKYKEFFLNLGNILPCSCKDNYYKHLNVTPLNDDVLSSKTKFVKWWLEMHNNVREMQKKRKLSYDEFINYYDRLYNNQNNDKYSYVILIIVIIVLSIGLGLYIKQKYY